MGVRGSSIRGSGRGEEGVVRGGGGMGDEEGEEEEEEGQLLCGGDRGVHYHCAWCFDC